MKIRSERDKRTYLIIALCAILVVMGVGYAAFSSLLTINGTANISNSWNIKITNIKAVNPCELSGTAYLEKEENKAKLLSINFGDVKMKQLAKIGPELICSSEAYDKTAPTHTDTTATFNTGLIKPSDERVYEVEVKNLGSIDAEITKTLINNVNSDAIVFSYDGVTDVPEQIISENDEYNKENLDTSEPFELVSGGTKYIYITVGYDSSVTSQPNNLTASVTVELNATQKEGSSGGVGEVQGTGFTGSIYRWNTSVAENGDSIVPVSGTKWCDIETSSGNQYDCFDTETECNTFLSENNYTETDTCQQKTGTFGGIGEYTTDASTLNKTYYLKHNVVDDIITNSYVCFVYNNAEHCMKGGDGGASFAANTQIIKDFQTFNSLPDNANLGCDFRSDHSYCYGGGFYQVLAESDGNVSGYGSSSEYCDVDDDGYSGCNG
ncbi:MAG: hypothetical protein IKF91_00170 [Bacilli bacterium]|nr:hypothetical protein [Bacilli bacterium]